MSQHSGTPAPQPAAAPSTGADASKSTAAADPPSLVQILTSRGYHVLLLASALIGFPIAAIAYGFVVAVNELSDLVWHTAPQNFGWSQPTAWYAIVILTIAGLITGLTIRFLPGTAGHLPVFGFAAGGSPTGKMLPGVVIAATATLVLGVVLGPEAPLVAIGGGLVMLVTARGKLSGNMQARTLLATAGSAAAISAIFGNPLVAVVLMLEIVGLAGSQVMLVLLPCMLSAGVGAIIFTGLNSWTGLNAPTLGIPGLAEAPLDGADLVWCIPIAIVAAVIAQLTRRIGLRVAGFAAKRTVLTPVVAGALVGLCAAAYTLLTDRSVLDVLQSGEVALPKLVSNPQAWPIAALIGVLLFKSIAYGISLGSFRGGPTFPAIFLGAVLGVLVAPLPGLGATAGLAIGMASATTAVLRLPVTSVVLVVLMLGSSGMEQIPVIMVGATIALITAVAMDGRKTVGGADPSTLTEKARPATA